MIKRKSFVHQLPSVCTVIQYVYIYIHKSMVEETPQLPGQTEPPSAVSSCITITSLIQNKTGFLSNNSCSFKFYFQKIKLNNISIYKRQFSLFFSYKISLKIYCHQVLMPTPNPVTLEKNSEHVDIVSSP